MGHSSSEDLRVHSRDLESILLPLRVECINGVLRVMVLRPVPVCQCLPNSVGHSLSTHRSRSRTRVPTDHLLSIEDLHCATELHAPWSWSTLDLVLWGLGVAQLK
jgi:hypothetical protein